MARLGRGVRARPFISSRPLTLPTNTVAPVLSTSGAYGGTDDAYVGDVVSMTTGTWTGSPSVYRYEWRRSDVPQAIPGATSSTYTLTSGDIGHIITGRVWASNLDGESATFAVAIDATFSSASVPRFGRVQTQRVIASSAGGGGTLSGAAVQNLVNDPQFNAASSEWGTTGFSLVSGATATFAGGGLASFSPTAVDQGVNYAPPGLTTFLAGTRYYASVKVRHTSTAGVVEIVLGSTSDDFASAQITTTGAFQTLTVSWVPQQDRPAATHGLAIRYKSGGGSFPAFDIDDASIATAAGAFWSGWRVGGKGAATATTTTGGGAATPTAARGASAALTGTGGGGAATLTGKKTPAPALTVTGGGSGTTTSKGAHTATLATSAGGTATFAVSSSAAATTLPPSMLFGGGGRTGRGHPAGGIAPRGVGASINIFARSGTLTGTGGGGATTTAKRAATGPVASSGGGGNAFTIGKGGNGSTVSSAGGAGAISAARVADTGGIVATFLMGGGGRVGRSHPAAGIAQAGRVTLSAFSPDNRAGSLAASGGGNVTPTGRKGSTASAQVSIPAPPPTFVDILTVAGVRATGGGSFAYSYTRSALRIGSVTGTAGGTGTFTAGKAVAGAATGTGGGQPPLTVRKGGQTAVTATAGGSFTYAYVTFEARVGRLAASGGGNATSTASRKALVTLTATGGGSITPTSRKGSRTNTTSSGGGSFAYAYSTAGLAAVGALTGHGGGNANVTSGKSLKITAITATDGGSFTAVSFKGAAFTLNATGGGNVRVRRAVRVGSFAAFTAGRIEPVRAGHIEPEGVLIR